MKRRAYRMNKTGSLDYLKFVEEELPALKSNEVTVATKAIGLNFADVFSVFGLYSATPKESFIPGLEFSGIVIAKGEDAKDFSIGDKVYGTTRFGAYTNLINVNENYLQLLPESWTYEEGAAFPAQALTAYYALMPLGNLEENQTVLIHSAAGGVGILANRKKKKKKAKTIGLVGSYSKFSVLKEEGFDAYLARSPHFVKEMKQILRDSRLDLVLECLGGSYFKDSYDLLAPMGRIVSYGSAGFTPKGRIRNWFQLALEYLNRPKIDVLSMISANKSVMAFNLIWLWEDVTTLRKHFSALQALSLSPQRIGLEKKFEELPVALQIFQSGTTIGKVIIKV